MFQPANLKFTLTVLTTTQFTDSSVNFTAIQKQQQWAKAHNLN